MRSRHQSRRPRRVALTATVAAALVGALLAPAAEASTTATSPQGHALAVTPPMGFNNWARFGCGPDAPNPGDTGPTESLILGQARALVDNGLAAKGYRTVTVDDCWMTHARDAQGALVTDTGKFPRGMADLGRRLHDMGLKFGIYEDIGTYTCGGFPGSWNHFQQDADQFAAWGVDYIKLDGCNMPSEADSASGYIKAYKDFGAAMKANSSKRDMVFSESSPAYFSIGVSDLSDWYTVIDGASQSGQLWREGNDVKMLHMGGSAWDKTSNGSGVMTQYGYNSLLARYSGPGDWNDPDFLITGDGLTDAESRTQVSLWAMMASPLILSTDVAALSAPSLKTLGNKDVIAVDQDGLGRQAGVVSRDGTVDVLARPLANGDRAVALLNRGTTAVPASTTLAGVGFTGSQCRAKVKDLWTGATSTTDGTIGATLDAHSTAVFRVTPGAGCTGQQPTGQLTGIGGKCVDDSGSGTAAGNPVVLHNCDAGTNQRWTLPGDGTVRTLGQCLDASYRNDDSRYTGYWAVLEPCDGRATQKWSYQRNGFLQNTGLTGLCLDDYASLTADDNPLIVGDCGTSRPNQQNQIWALPT
ncbi:ricin-type beta-trefoil lectin domain protein [Streptomyces sp. NBC_01267]|uniref:ricin-type beta-trefoil lectin domain protein n=1 Tax=unclassified Streptomyces TaxID=2593676 RepID=UPI002023E3BC|nr:MULTISPECIES: ricin-type beta-trefoil lectin domain protein [unclassified Streptomyces]WSC24192.1 ricin-type beta-trefoil lectin domain protein [Streptomyces sp. NBC_01766]WSV58078.1 ricin-type beta-trefoil lectin domain protein [Streptomyces sp. NBC_01014]